MGHQQLSDISFTFKRLPLQCSVLTLDNMLRRARLELDFPGKLFFHKFQRFDVRLQTSFQLSILYC